MDSTPSTGRASKLRVRTVDAHDALQVIRNSVEEATGLGAEPEIQEVDGADLVVELRLSGPPVAVPGLVARAVERSSPDLDVLSTWNEVGRSAVPTGAVAGGQVIFDGLGERLPTVVRRAIRDDLPTAQWDGIGRSAGSLPGADGRRAWQLAVPVAGRCGRPLVRYRRRRGYSFRFGTHDVEAAVVDAAALLVDVAS